ncbi:class III poly(R)-hydroxyalkanoic acid synthase subunit PhaC [Alkalilimnicola sp. S0819]|uniref:class III poly(R)-hydroxyalkanoic acid synthase subunit PhaC n=1 Tax=Alkalilimnicola sp. S0819 TaxID=2613922 RepID=UPI001261669F|nr:class III poly(R)-hydroxyalkanoic acid synthase subunit PhaC [Alkalilimnicola sp. S0819]KAB7628303.1 class III poly(R)-hydroxyalkanoic acid synthase subunit PhaC [Alkalilimnicola sp. S0819]MPQ15201.1 class III poly(R)-hydroxyalkanoic acid synthase subunit PhaC [Alkalilimnicola sp. S0819]
MTFDDYSREAARWGRSLTRALGQAAAMQPVPVGVSPREALLRDGPCTLYRYQPVQERAAPAPPALIVYSLVNRPYILDLKPRRSMIRALLEAGLDVYLLDWGEPEPLDRFTGLDDYINGYLHRAVMHVRGRHAQAPVPLIGICQGGTLSLCYAALHPESLAGLVTMVTPVDFHTPDNQLWRLSRHIDVEALVDAHGNIPAEQLNQFFLGLKPFRLLSQRYLDMAELADQPEALADFLRMEQWMYDSPAQAGEAFRQFAGELYQQNRLIRGELRLGGHAVELSRIRAPLLNIWAEGDHLVPEASARALGEACGSSDYSEIGFPGGHLSPFISGRAQRDLYPRISRWLLDHAPRTRKQPA